MRLENLVFDARDPHRLGSFWEAALGTTTMTDNEHGFETRLDLGEHFLDLRLDAGEDFDAVTAGIVERGGRLVEHDWGALRWRVYADGSGNEFCVLPAA